MSEITGDEARRKLESEAQKVSEADLEKVLNKKKEIEDKFKTDGPLGRYIEDFKLLFSLIQDYWNGDYREISWSSIAAVVAALIYVLSPVDLMPDVIPVIGLVDDAMVIAVCLNLIESDLHAYKKWKMGQVES